MKKYHMQKGFTLVEMIVAIGLFTAVLFIASSAFLSVLNADRKSRSVRVAMDNLNLSIEDMSRRIKTGTTYDCGAVATATNTNDCAAPGSGVISFIAQGDSIVTPTVYMRGVGPGALPLGGCGAGYTATQGCIIRSNWDAGGANLLIAATGPEIDVQSLSFVVGGSAPLPDVVQPYVVILISGSVGQGGTASNFRIQTMVTQRAYDY